MKTKYIIVLLSIFLINIVKTTAQTWGVSPEDAKSFAKLHSDMLYNAKISPYISNKSCKAVDLVKIVGVPSLITKDEEYEVSLMLLRDMVYMFRDFDGIDKGLFDTVGDKALQALSATTNFQEFVTYLTGKNELNYDDDDIKTIRYYYDIWKSTSKVTKVSIMSEESVRLAWRNTFTTFDGCKVTTITYLKLLKLSYPNATWKLITNVTVKDCECTGKTDSEVKSGEYEYSTIASSTLNSKQIKFDELKSSKIDIISLECCPEKEKIGIQLGSNVTRRDGNEIVPGLYSDKRNFQVGLYGGLPLGEEKDFYSLNYGGDITYLFNLNGYFNAGLGVGYTRFAGKDGIDGAGFAPLFGTAEYDFSDRFALRAKAGYALSTKTDGSGGVYFGLGFGWNITPKISIGPNFSSINLDGGSFNSAAIGITGTF